MKTEAKSEKVLQAIIFIRFIVGAVFLTEGIQKFLYNDTLGVGRFIKIGIPAPQFFAPFVGIVEIVFGFMLIIGFFTSISSIPLIINISVAIITTKIPILAKAGFWALAHEARTDFSMLFGLIFLLIAGSGTYSLDHYMHRKKAGEK